jgi:hypothetical protein
MELTLVKPKVPFNSAPYFDGSNFKETSKGVYEENIYITAYLNASRYDYPA